MTSVLWAVASILWCCVAAYLVWVAGKHGQGWLAYRMQQIRSDARMDALEGDFRKRDAVHNTAISRMAADLERAVGKVDVEAGELPLSQRVKTIENSLKSAAYTRAQQHQRFRG